MLPTICLDQAIVSAYILYVAIYDLYQKGSGKYMHLLANNLIKQSTPLINRRLLNWYSMYRDRPNILNVISRDVAITSAYVLRYSSYLEGPHNYIERPYREGLINLFVHLISYIVWHSLEDFKVRIFLTARKI